MNRARSCIGRHSWMIFLPLLSVSVILGCGSEEPVHGPWYESRDSVAFRTLVESPSICRDCIELDRVAVLGDTAGDGYIEWTQSVTRDSLGNFWVGQRGTVKVFDSAGNYLRQVGSSGEGPMEFRFIAWMHTNEAGRVHIIDPGNLRETIVGANFELHSERRIPGAFGSYPAIAPLPGDGRYALNMYYVGSGQTGLPLHIVDGEEIISSFGEVIDEDSPPLNQAAARRRLATDHAGHVFSTEYFNYAVEAWTDSGERITGFVGPVLNEKEPVIGPFTLDNPPPNMINAIQVDGQDRLWVVRTQVKDDWRDRMVETVGRDGSAVLQPSDPDPRFLYTMLIDVVDLNEGLIIASSGHEELIEGFIGEGLGLEIQYTEQGIPQAVVWGVSLREH